MEFETDSFWTCRVTPVRNDNYQIQAITDSMGCQGTAMYNQRLAELTENGRIGMSITIYHNPRCSKSRQTLTLIEERGNAIDIIEYLKTPPDFAMLKSIIDKLGIKPEALLRKNEAEYKQAGLDRDDVSDDEIIQAMVEHPILIQRPIVINNEKAAIGRPPEDVLAILD